MNKVLFVSRSLNSLILQVTGAVWIYSFHFKLDFSNSKHETTHKFIVIYRLYSVYKEES